MSTSSRGQLSSPSVAVEEAREALQRALLFGGKEDVVAAEAQIDEALDRQADIYRVEHAAIIEEVLAKLPSLSGVDSGGDDLISKAKRGDLSYPQLVDAFTSDRRSLGLTPREEAFVEEDIRLLRVVVLARRDGVDLSDVQTVFDTVGSVQSEGISFAARADPTFDIDSLSSWITEYADILDDSGQGGAGSPEVNGEE